MEEIQVLPTPENKTKPFKLSKEIVGKLEEVFALDGSIGEACFYAGINRDTYYNWIEKWPKLKQKFDSLREKPVLKARNTVVNALGDPTIALKYLERKRKSEFALRTEITGADGKQIEGIKVNIVSNKKHDPEPTSDNSVPTEFPSDIENSNQ